MPRPAHSPLLPYERFLEEVETVALLIEADAWQPDFLVGIGRGGLVPAAYLSHRTGIQMLSVDHSSGEIGFGDELLDKLAAKIRDGHRILIVDDINDSGATIAYLRAAIDAKSGDPAGLRIAVLVNNIRSRAPIRISWQRDRPRRRQKMVRLPLGGGRAARDAGVDALAVPERLG